MDWLGSQHMFGRGTTCHLSLGYMSPNDQEYKKISRQVRIIFDLLFCKFLPTFFIHFLIFSSIFDGFQISFIAFFSLSNMSERSSFIYFFTNQSISILGLNCKNFLTPACII